MSPVVYRTLDSTTSDQHIQTCSLNAAVVVCIMSPTPADATNKNKTKRSPPPLPQSLPLPTVSLPTHLRNALSLPPKWLALYDEYVTKNAGQISQMESALRSLTYIIPGMYSCLHAVGLLFLLLTNYKAPVFLSRPIPRRRDRH